MGFVGRITVYSITGCPFCKAAKAKLGELNLPFTEVNLDDYPEQRSILIGRTQKRTVPQIFFNERFIGGNDEFQKLVTEEMEFQELLKYVKESPVPEEALALPKMKQPVQPTKTDDSYNALNGNEAVPRSSANAKEAEFAEIVKEFKANSGVIKDRRRMLIFSIPKCFTGEELVTFVSKKKKIDVDRAILICQDLMKYKFVVAVEPQADHIIAYDKTLYRLVEDNPHKALNTKTGAYEAGMPASELSGILRKKILQLYGKYLSDNGKSVDYKGLGSSVEFKEYVALTTKLQRVEIEKISREEKLAFFINIYNALVIHGNVVNGFPENTLQRYKFFNNTRYVVGGAAYSLQDIENGVLRSNRKGVGMIQKPFNAKDPRHDLILVPNEPLIHFALVCGAKSCPPIKTYSAENIMSELTLSAESFLESDDGCLVKKAENTVYLSMIFKWYSEDFGKYPTETLKWVHQHMADGEKKTNLHAVMSNKDHKLEFLTYNWGTNKK